MVVEAFMSIYRFYPTHIVVPMVTVCHIRECHILSPIYVFPFDQTNLKMCLCQKMVYVYIYGHLSAYESNIVVTLPNAFPILLGKLQQFTNLNKASSGIIPRMQTTSMISVRSW